MLRIAALILLGGLLLIHFGQTGGLRLTAPSSGSSLSSAAAPALGGIRSAAQGILD